jgi:hypothetical protein
VKLPYDFLVGEHASSYDPPGTTSTLQFLKLTGGAGGPRLDPREILKEAGCLPLELDMKRVRAISTMAALIALVALCPPVARAEDQRPDLRLERSPAPVPLVPPDARKSIEKDVEQASKELKRQERTDAIIRDNVKAVPSRPDLGPDVTGGIQSRALRDALRSR